MNSAIVGMQRVVIESSHETSFDVCLCAAESEIRVKQTNPLNMMLLNTLRVVMIAVYNLISRKL